MAVTDLTGTKWQSKSTYSATSTSTPTVYSINTVNNTGFGIDSGSIFLYGAFLKDGGYVSSENTVCIADRVYVSSPDSWSIEITGGTDATNADLIAWLQANATQIQDESNPISIGNLPIVDMYFGTQQVKKIYLGNTLVWEKEDTGYTVTLNCSGGSNYTAGSVYVYDSTYADRSSSNLIFSQDSIDLSAYPVTLTVKSGYCTVIIATTGSFMGSRITSNDFAIASEDYATSKDFIIDKNGTIEFGADDWDD